MNTVLVEQQEFVTHFTAQSVDWSRDAVMRKRSQALRYEVYCEECGFLDKGDYPQGLEADDYDDHSAHFAALNLRAELAGYVRLVRPDPIQTFPFQTHCVEVLDGVALPPAEQSGEISRLMVRQDYRRRVGDLPPSGAPGEAAVAAQVENDRRSGSPQILLSLYREMYAYSLDNNIRYWYAAMERSLARALVRMGFNFQQIGPTTDYYGPVAPYVADLRMLEAKLAQNNPALLAWMRNSNAAS